MKQVIILASILCSLQALAANPIVGLVRDLFSVSSGKTEYFELMRRYNSSQKHNIIDNEYIQVAVPQTQRNARILVAAFEPTVASNGVVVHKYGFEIFVGRRNSQLLKAYETELNAKYGNKTVVDNMLMTKADEGILSEVEKLGSKAEELASAVASKYGLDERDLFTATSKIHVNQSIGGYETYKVFEVAPKVDARAVQDLLQVLTETPM